MNEIEQTLHAMLDTENALVSRIKELEERVAHLENETLPDDTVTQLEAKVESLTRTLDLWQELTGIEIVARPVVVHGQCAKCDYVGPLQNGICEGCFYEEIGV